MPSTSTNDTPHSLAQDLLRNLSELSQRIGPERVSELLLTLNQEKYADRCGHLVRHFCAIHFHVQPNELLFKRKQPMSRLRSLCFHLLHHHPAICLDQRTIGRLFDLRENSVNLQIKNMQYVLDRPANDPSLFEAHQIIYHKISLSLKKEEPSDSSIKDLDAQSQYSLRKFKKIIKGRMEQYGYTVAELSRHCQIPMKTLYDFFKKDNGSLKLHHAFRLQHHFKIPNLL